MSRSLCPEVLGFVAAAAFPTLVMCVSAPFEGHGSFEGYRYDLETAMVLAAILFPIALVAVVLLGIPAFVLLYRFRPGRWWMPVVAGLILGVPLLLALPGQPTMPQALFYVPLTALSALVFWLVWRWAGERKSACCAR